MLRMARLATNSFMNMQLISLHVIFTSISMSSNSTRVRFVFSAVALIRNQFLVQNEDAY
jgi:hypothetical protein